MQLENPRSSHYRLLAVARAVWLFYAVMLLALALASLPEYYNRVMSGTVPDISFEIGRPVGNAYFIARAEAAGLSLSQFLIANIIASLFVIIIHYIVAGLIFWRLPKSWFGLLTAFVILLTGTSAVEDARQVASLMEQWSKSIQLLIGLGALVWPVYILWLYLFPDGRAVPRWARWPITVIVALFTMFMTAGILDSVGVLPPAFWQFVNELEDRASVLYILVLPGLLVALASQIYRYQRVSGPVERQQTKWFLFGLGLFVALFPLYGLGPLERLDAISGSFSLVIIPITIAISLLRYRLWDIDVVIRRTVGYAILTGLLAMVYFGSIIILQRLLSPLTGNSTLATILSTLLIAALFLPLRRRIQAIIDQRFYRRKYDAQKTLEQFAQTARDETDLEKLTAELLRVIQETMEPETVSIWLKPAEATPVAQRPMSAETFTPISQDTHVRNS